MAKFDPHGMRVFLLPDGNISIIPPGMDPLPDGRELLGVVGAEVRFAVDKITTAKIKIFVDVDQRIDALPSFRFVDPVSGRIITKMQFDDGSTWEQD